MLGRVLLKYLRNATAVLAVDDSLSRKDALNLALDAFYFGGEVSRDD